MNKVLKSVPAANLPCIYLFRILKCSSELNFAKSKGIWHRKMDVYINYWNALYYFNVDFSDRRLNNCTVDSSQVYAHFGPCVYPQNMGKIYSQESWWPFWAIRIALSEFLAVVGGRKIDWWISLLPLQFHSYELNRNINQISIPCSNEPNHRADDNGGS